MEFLDTENYRLHLEKRIAENPIDIDAIIHLGVIELEYYHNFDEGRKLLEEAVQREPLNVEAKFWLAHFLFLDFFEYDNAIKILREALELNPNSPECLSDLAWIICEVKKPINEAIPYVEKAIELRHDWPMLHCQLAGFYLDSGRIEAAEQEVLKAYQITAMDLNKIENEVQRYYESVITGRSWQDMKKEFAYIIERIENAKRKHQ